MIKKHIKAKGYPLTSPKYPTAHMLASKEELHKFGKKSYKKLDVIAKKHPGELLGTHHGKKVVISSIVPKYLRKEVRFHEKREIKLMKHIKMR